MAAKALILSAAIHRAKKSPRQDYVLDEFDLQLSQVRQWRKQGKNPEDMPEWAQKIDSAVRLVQREWRQKCCRRYRGGLTGLLEGHTGPCDGPAMLRTPWGWMWISDIAEGNENSMKAAESKIKAAVAHGSHTDSTQSNGPGNESAEKTAVAHGSPKKVINHSKASHKKYINQSSGPGNESKKMAVAHGSPKKDINPSSTPGNKSKNTPVEYGSPKKDINPSSCLGSESKNAAVAHGSPNKEINQSSGPGNESNDPDPVKQEEGSGGAESKKKIQAQHGKSVVTGNSATNVPCSSSPAGRPEREKETLGVGNRKPKRNSMDKHGLNSGSAAGNAGLSRARVKESLDAVLSLRRDFVTWRDSYWNVSKVAKKAPTSFDAVPSAAEFARWTTTMKLHVVALVNFMAEGTPVGRAFVRDAPHLIKAAKKLGKLLHDQTDVDAGIAAFHRFDKAMQENGYVRGAFLVEFEEWAEAMVGKLEGMMRDCNEESKGGHVGAVLNFVEEQTADVKSDTGTVKTRDGSEESKKRHHTGAAAKAVEEQAADAKPDTQVVLISQHDDASVSKSTVTKKYEQDDTARHNCSNNTAQAPEQQNDTSSVGTPEGRAMHSLAADSEEQQASGHQQDSDSAHQCRGARKSYEGEQPLSGFQNLMLLRRNEVSGAATRHHHHHQQEEETVFPPHRQSITSVGRGGSHSKRTSLEASARCNIMRRRDTFASALPRKQHRASMEETRSDARRNSLGDFTHQPQERGGNRRQPARNSLDSSSIHHRRPNVYREDATAVPEESSCGSKAQHRFVAAPSPMQGVIEQEGTHHPATDSSRSPRRMIIRASTDRVQDSFAFATPSSLTSTMLPPQSESRHQGGDSATCPVINTPVLPPLAVAGPSAKEIRAAAAASELHPPVQHNRNGTSTQAGLSSAVQGDAGNGMRPVAQSTGRRSMDIRSLARRLDSAHHQQGGKAVSSHTVINASRLSNSQAQVSQQNSSITTRKEPHTRNSIAIVH